MTKQNKRDHKKQILQTLNSQGILPTSRLSAIIGLNAGRSKEEFEKLREEGLIRKIEERIATYWEITKKGKEEV